MQLTPFDKNATVFNFNDQLTSVRFFTDEEHNIWAIAKDIGDILGLSKIRNHLSNIPDDWKDARETDTLGGKQKMTINKEPAIYKLIMRSNKPEAEKFQRWVCEDVLPAIRKTGQYKLHQEQMRQITQTQQVSCDLLMKYFPNDDLVQQRVRDVLMNSLDDTTNLQKARNYDLTTILKIMGFSVHKYRPQKFIGMGGYVSQKYVKKFKKKAQKTLREVNGAARYLNIYTVNEVKDVKKWIGQYLEKKPNFW